ncbi:phosphopantothenoylcysteine decarboxylase, partial [Halomonas sp.]|uniref:phosphopantothenoylcysteine decarboxylase domain-containing protein n=1 Tax=Halomonas sp. TaxID=1486246 RepID=UPI0025C56730
TVAALPATGRPLVVGFAAETRDLEAYARGKLARKGLDMIVANDVSQAGLGFGSDDNAALLLWRDASAAATTGGQEGQDQAGLHQETLGPQPKRELALAVVRRALACLAARPSR